MDLELKGATVLVTGGSRGIGFACARAFLAEGAKVAIASRSQENLEKARSGLGGVETFAADLTQARAAADLVDAVERRLGPIDVLVNCAGAAKRTSADELTPEAWRAAMDAKYFSYVNVIDPLIKRMAGRGGSAIVNVIGSGGKLATPTHIGGGAANAAHQRGGSAEARAGAHADAAHAAGPRRSPTSSSSPPPGAPAF